MNSKGVLDLKNATRTKGISSESRFLKNGRGDTHVFSEGFESLAFGELSKAVDDADSAAAEDLQNPLKRMELIYAMALLRDAEYCHAGRRFMLAVGSDAEMRGLYEGAKIHEDAKNER